MKSEFRSLRLSQLDRSLPSVRSTPSRPASGWLASVREALGLSLESVGRRLSTARQVIQRLEKYEASDRITLRNLRRVAEAMDCELVYAIVPRSGTFAELAEKPARDQARRNVESVLHTMALEDQKPQNSKQLIEGEAQRRLIKKGK